MKAFIVFLLIGASFASVAKPEDKFFSATAGKQIQIVEAILFLWPHLKVLP